MSQADKAMVRRYLEEVWGKQNVDVLDELVTPDCIFCQPPWEPVRGLEAMKQGRANSTENWPDIKMKIGGIIAEGDHAAAMVSVKGENLEEICGPDMAGTELKGCGVAWFCFKNGKISGVFFAYDSLSPLAGLDIPAMDQIEE